MAAQIMQQFRFMNPDEFSKFRGFFSPAKCPVMAGPSGLYSSKVPVVDLLLSGGHLPESLAQFLDSHDPYYPATEKPIRTAAVESARAGHSVIDRIHELGDPENLARDFAALQKTMAAFRSKHMQSVVKFIPGIAQSDHGGTGGEGIGLLRERIAMHGAAANKCPYHCLMNLVQKFRGAK